MFAIVREGRVIWRGNVRETAIRLATTTKAFAGVVCVDLFGVLSPIDQP